MRDDMPRPIYTDSEAYQFDLVDPHDDEASRVDVFLYGVAFGTLVTGCIVDALHVLGAF